MIRPRLEAQAETRDAARLLSLYFTGLPLGKGLPETDLQPADDLALLSAQSFIEAWALSPTDRRLVSLTGALSPNG